MLRVDRLHDAFIPCERVRARDHGKAFPRNFAGIVDVQAERVGVSWERPEIGGLPMAPAHRMDFASRRPAATDHPAAVAETAGPARVTPVQGTEIRDDTRFPDRSVDRRALATLTEQPLSQSFSAALWRKQHTCHC